MDLAASFQATVIRSLVGTLEKIAVELRPKTLIVAGGVACNLALREAAETTSVKLGIPVYFPSKHLSTDNAAMIAAAGYFHLLKGETADLGMTADVTMRLQNLENEDAELKRKKVKYRL
jgi:N6-L-threonylcarbamoyladenine synthase